jgi:hypothetical protein
MAHGQSATPAVQPAPQAQIMDTGQTPSYPAMRPDIYVGFCDLINEYTAAESQHEAEVRRGADRILPLINFSQEMQIREDEEQDLQTILVETFNNVEKSDREFARLNIEAHLKHDPQLAAKRDELGRLRPKIYREGIEKLRQRLGEDTFHKVEIWVDLHEMGDRMEAFRKANAATLAAAEAARRG